MLIFGRREKKLIEELEDKDKRISYLGDLLQSSLKKLELLGGISDEDSELEKKEEDDFLEDYGF